MNDKREIGFDILENTDVEKIAEMDIDTPVISEISKKRMLEMSRNKFNNAKSNNSGKVKDTENDEYIVSDHVEIYRRSTIKRIVAAVAGCAAVTVLIGANILYMKKFNPTPDIPSSEVITTHSISKAELVEKAKDNNFVKYFDRLSADYTYTLYEPREWHKDPETHTGKVFLDEINLTASGTEDVYVDDECMSRSLYAIKDKIFFSACESYAETDFVNGGFKLLETPDKYYTTTEDASDKVIINQIKCVRLTIDNNETDSWEITGSRTENGREIVSISGNHRGNDNMEGVYREYNYTGEIDAETGLILSYDEHDSEGKQTYTFKVINYKFDDEAIEFRTASDIISEAENGGYTKR